MEEFSTAEKNKPCVSSTLSPKFVLGPTRSRPKPGPLESSTQSVPSSSVVPADGGAQPEPPTDRAEAAVADSPRAFLHRKLSQCNSHTRSTSNALNCRRRCEVGFSVDCITYNNHHLEHRSITKDNIIVVPSLDQSPPELLVLISPLPAVTCPHL